jgi:hypothetical protein
MAPAGLSAQLVSGRVVDGNTGAPLVGAAVSIDRDETILEERLVIDGTFRFVVEQPGPYRLTVEAFGYESRSIGVIVLEEGFTGIEIALAPRVVELEGAEAHVGASVVRGTGQLIDQTSVRGTKWYTRRGGPKAVQRKGWAGAIS